MAREPSGVAGTLLGPLRLRQMQSLETDPLGAFANDRHPSPARDRPPPSPDGGKTARAMSGEPGPPRVLPLAGLMNVASPPEHYPPNDEGPPKRALNRICLGGDLLSHPVTEAVPSAREGLTSGFGMGPGVSPPLWPPKRWFPPDRPRLVVEATARKFLFESASPGGPRNPIASASKSQVLGLLVPVG